MARVPSYPITAYSRGKEEERMKLLRCVVAAGADPEIADSVHSYTPIMIASLNGFVNPLVFP
jgi:hypothetical protein